MDLLGFFHRVRDEAAVPVVVMSPPEASAVTTFEDTETALLVMLYFT